MSFIVSARTANREISSQHVSMLSALERALILAGSGLSDVAVTDHHGRVHSPAEFSRLLMGVRPDVAGVKPAVSREAA